MRRWSGWAVALGAFLAGLGLGRTTPSQPVPSPDPPPAPQPVPDPDPSPPAAQGLAGLLSRPEVAAVPAVLPIAVATFYLLIRYGHTRFYDEMGLTLGELGLDQWTLMTRAGIAAAQSFVWFVVAYVGIRLLRRLTGPVFAFLMALTVILGPVLPTVIANLIGHYVPLVSLGTAPVTLAILANFVPLLIARLVRRRGYRPGAYIAVLSLALLIFMSALGSGASLMGYQRYSGSEDYVFFDPRYPSDWTDAGKRLLASPFVPAPEDWRTVEVRYVGEGPDPMAFCDLETSGLMRLSLVGAADGQAVFLLQTDDHDGSGPSSSVLTVQSDWYAVSNQPYYVGPYSTDGIGQSLCF